MGQRRGKYTAVVSVEKSSRMMISSSSIWSKSILGKKIHRGSTRIELQYVQLICVRYLNALKCRRKLPRDKFIWIEISIMRAIRAIYRTKRRRLWIKITHHLDTRWFSTIQTSKRQNSYKSATESSLTASITTHLKWKTLWKPLTFTAKCSARNSNWERSINRRSHMTWQIIWAFTEW